MSYRDIPAELRKLRQWGGYRRERDGKPPRQARNPDGPYLSKTSPSQFASYEEAVAAVKAGKLDGLAFVLTENDPYWYGDLDGCIVDGVLNPSARALVERVDTYTEISQSGNSLHIVGRGEVGTGASAKGKLGHPVPWHRDGADTELAIYDRKAIVYLTADVFEGRRTVNDCQLEAEYVHRLIVNIKNPPVPPAKALPPVPNDRLDDLVAILDGRSNGDDHRARCPHHSGRSANSLSIKWGNNGSLLLHCHAGCEYADVLRVCRERLGLQATAADVGPHEIGRPPIAVAPERRTEPEVAMPEDGFIADYVRTFEPCTEAPRQYHVAVALVLLSLVVGTQAYIGLAGRVGLNLYIMVLGPTTVPRKSTAVNFGRSVLRKLEDQVPLFPSEVEVSMGSFSSEALAKRLAEQEIAFGWFDELGRFLKGAASKSYLADAKELLTEVYGGWVSGRLLVGQNVKPGRCFLTLIACTTPSRLAEEIEVEDVMSGFLGRWLMVHSQGSGRVMAWPPTPDAAKVDALVRQLGEVFSEVRGEITFSLEAQKVITEWYEGHRETFAEQDDGELMLPIFLRLDTTVRKLAALFEISAGARGRVGVGERAASDATTYVDYLLERIRRDLLSTVFGGEFRKLGRVLRVVGEKPGITRTELLRETRLQARELDQFLRILTEDNLIVERPGRLGVSATTYSPVGSGE